MSIDDSLSRSGFAQLYFQAAQVRHNDLSEFFDKLDTEHHGNVTDADVHLAIQAAAEIHEHLQRAVAYLSDVHASVSENYP